MLAARVGAGCKHIVLDSREVVGVALILKHTAVHMAWMRLDSNFAVSGDTTPKIKDLRIWIGSTLF